MINQEINKIQSQLTKAEAEFRRDAAVLSHLHDQICCEFVEPLASRVIGTALTALCYAAFFGLTGALINSMR